MKFCYFEGLGSFFSSDPGAFACFAAFFFLFFWAVSSLLLAVSLSERKRKGGSTLEQNTRIQ